MRESDGLRTLARLADEAGARAIAAGADALAEGLREGRFYVVCVGQFKRGKSTLLNALVGEPRITNDVLERVLESRRQTGDGASRPPARAGGLGPAGGGACPGHAGGGRGCD